jgi:hypothetical protein
MIQDFFKLKYWPVKICAVAFLVVQSCHSGSNSSNDNPAERAVPATDDTAAKPSEYTNVKPGNNAANGRPTNDANEERQKFILMQIDSTYNAIALLDDAKDEMTATSPAELTVAERNKKSKAIFNINILQNELTRALDASILANLRVKTDELAGITAELEKNVGHLQTVTEKLNKATLCIGRLTNLLAMGLSKGYIKPLTPKGASAESVKATVN